MTSPKATFAIPCRNGAPFLRALLESLLAQTCQDFALVLVDDASTDDSAAVARQVCGERITIVRNDAPLGLIPNFNRCAELVRTPFFCLSHADDVYEPQYLERLLGALEAAPAAGFAHCRAGAIDEHGRPYDAPAERFKGRFWAALPGPSAAAHFRLLYAGNYIVCPTVLFRTAAYRSAGGFRADLRYAADWELWLRMVARGLLPVAVDAPLFRYRRHDDSATRAAARVLVRYREEIEILQWARDEAGRSGFGNGWPPSFALRNSLLQDAGDDLLAGLRDEAATKLAFLRDHAPATYAHPTVRVFRLLARLGRPGTWLLRAARRAALHFARVP